MYDVIYELDEDDESYFSYSGFDFGFPEEPKNGCICKKCEELSPYAEPNQKDGSFLCYNCRTYG